MRRPIFKAGVWTVVGLAIAFAVVSANSGHRRAVTTAASAAQATVATAASHDDCTASDVCCPRESKAAVVAAAPRKHARTVAAASKKAAPAGTAGAVIAIDPETGELGMPNSTQMQDLNLDSAPAQMVPMKVVDLPGGGIAVENNGQYVDFAAVHVSPSGKKVFGCADNPLPAPQPAPHALEEK